MIRKLILFGGAALLVSIGLLWFEGRPSAAYSAQAGDPPDSATVAAFAKASCDGCHTIPGIPNAVGIVGPDLTFIGSDAGTRVPGMAAEAYIRQALLYPDAFIAPECPYGPCPASVMFPNYEDRVDPAELDLIVSYLTTLVGQGIVSAPPYELTPIEIVRPAETEIIPFAETPRKYDDAQILLGKYLFFDPRLSGDAKLSCATCHQPDHAFSGVQKMSPGFTGTKYFRNAPTVMNTVFQEYLYWDGRMDGADMPTLVRDHIVEAHFMNSDGRLMVERVKQVPEYVQLFRDAYRAAPSFGKVLEAITAYVHSLNSGLSPYDRFVAGEEDALSDEAASGLRIFQEHCESCHNGPTFSDNSFHVSGMADSGEIWSDPIRHFTFRRFFRQLGAPNYRALTDDPGLFALTKNDSDRGAFRTAPLREVARTAPYMHNGSLATLEDVVHFYSDRDGLDLLAAEVAQLVAFLESLSSEPIAVQATEQPEYQLRTLGENQ